MTLCGLTAAASFAVMPAWHYWPARLQGLAGVQTWMLGWIWVLIMLASMGGTHCCLAWCRTSAPSASWPSPACAAA